MFNHRSDSDLQSVIRFSRGECTTDYPGKHVNNEYDVSGTKGFQTGTGVMRVYYGEKMIECFTDTDSSIVCGHKTSGL